MKRQKYSPVLEMLEDRLTPSLTISTDAFGNLAVTGTPDFNAGTTSQPVAVIETAANTYQIQENGNPLATVYAPGSVSINFSQSSLDDTINIALGGNSIGGNLSITDGAAGNNTLNLGSDAAAGNIGGNLSVTNINTITTTGAATYTTGGNFSIQNALKNRPFSFVPGPLSVGGNLSVSAGNGGDTTTLNATTTIGGNLFASFGNGNNALTVPAGATVGGSFTYLGGSGGDSVTLDGTVGRNVYANLGAAGTTATTQNSFTQSVAAVYGSNLTILGGIGGNTITLGGLTAGSAYFNLGSTGSVANNENTWTFSAGAAIDGSAITYIGGAGLDNATFNGTTASSHAYFNLGAGNDSFTLGPATNLAFLYIDFGAGTDSFTNNAGATAPPLRLVNLP
jgi:hypothetical protein